MVEASVSWARCPHGVRRFYSHDARHSFDQHRLLRCQYLLARLMHMHDLVHDLFDRVAVGAAVLEDLRWLSFEAVGQFFNGQSAKSHACTSKRLRLATPPFR